MARGAVCLALMCLGGCRSEPGGRAGADVAAGGVASGGASAAREPSAPAPSAGSAGSPALPAAAVPSAGAEPAAAADPRAAFLVGTQGESVSLRSLDGQSRTVVPELSSWLHDPSHGLLWFLDEDQLGVADLRGEAPPTILAKGLPGVGALWVEWPKSNAAQFVRPETGCEESAEAVELKLGAKATLRVVESDERRALSGDGRRWVQQQLKRAETPAPAARGFDPGAPRVALPKGWSGCDDAERCGLAASFGSGPLRLVLVRGNLGADCFQLGCLLYDPATARFASPPVRVDEGGMPSLTAQPARWTSAEDAAPGSCGPYRFDERGGTFLAHRYLCRLEGASSGVRCEELPGEGIGWLRPGVVVGSLG